MTEDEAKTKWCAHTVASHSDPRAKIGGQFNHNCIGSECMAWRESTPKRGAEIERRTEFPSHEEYMGGLWETIEPDFDDPPGTRTVYVRYEKVSCGYCGLAGQP